MAVENYNQPDIAVNRLKAENAKAAAETALALAESYRDQAYAAAIAGAVGGIYDTYANLDTAAVGLANGNYLAVQDETESDLPTVYSVSGGVATKVGRLKESVSGAILSDNTLIYTAVATMEANTSETDGKRAVVFDAATGLATEYAWDDGGAQWTKQNSALLTEDAKGISGGVTMQASTAAAIDAFTTDDAPTGAVIETPTEGKWRISATNPYAAESITSGIVSAMTDGRFRVRIIEGREIQAHWFGALLDNSNDDEPAITLAAAASALYNLPCVIAPPHAPATTGERVCLLGAPVTIPEGGRVIIGDRVVVTPNADHDAFVVGKDTQLWGPGIIRLGTGKTAAGVVVDGSTLPDAGEALCLLNGFTIDGHPTSGSFSGTGILLEAVTASARVSWVQASNVDINRCTYGVRLHADSPDGGAVWVNGNTFADLAISGCQYLIEYDSVGQSPSNTSGNVWSNMMLQPIAQTEYLMRVHGDGNVFLGKAWDAGDANQDRPVYFSENSAYNTCILGGVGANRVEDRGYLNQILDTFRSPHVTTASIAPGALNTPSFAGNQDDLLAYCDTLGTVAQTGGTAITGGSLSNCFDPEANGEYATWGASSAAVITITPPDVPTTSVEAIGLHFGSGNIPTTVKIEAYKTGVGLVTLLDTTANESLFVRADHSLNAASVDYWQITLDSAAQFRLERVFAFSSKFPGKAYLPLGGGTVLGNLVLSAGLTLGADLLEPTRKIIGSVFDGNNAASGSAVTASSGISAYRYGLSAVTVSAASGWPMDGVVLTLRTDSGWANRNFQMLFPHGPDGSSNYPRARVWNNTGSAWESWWMMPKQIAADSNDSISNAAGTDAAIIDAIRDELHDLKDKMRTSKILAT